MGYENMLFIILLGLISLVIAYFYYYKKSFIKSYYRLLLGLLRWIVIWVLCILIINPMIENHTSILQKPKMVVLVDNSQSIKHFGQDSKVNQLVDSIKNSQNLYENFETLLYKFSKDISTADYLDFSGITSDINNAIQTVRRINHDKQPIPVIIISDGNQTYGKDYEYIRKGIDPIFPICVGDTTKYSDLKVSQINVNKYAFVGNIFPAEILINYSGDKNIDARVDIFRKNKSVYNTKLELSKTKNFVKVIAKLDADKVDKHIYKVVVKGLQNEKNIENNSRSFGIEFVDKKSKIAIISDKSHPDIGLFYKALKSDKQRQISIFDSSIDEKTLKNQDAFIIYQPDFNFSNVFRLLGKWKKNYFVIAGAKTDWSFLNKAQSFVQKQGHNPDLVEDVWAVPNMSYSNFMFEDIGFSDFPSLKMSFGTYQFNGIAQPLLYKVINDIKTQEPIWVTIDRGSQRVSYLFVENIWQWRMKSFVRMGSFLEFDNFIGKLFFYLSSDNSKNRLNLEIEPFYYQGSSASIKAYYVDKNFEVDMSAQLILEVKSKDGGENKVLPFIAKQNHFEVDLSELAVGNYNFVVKELTTKTQKVGNFKVIAFNQEGQFVSANYNKLKKLAINTRGKMLHSVKSIEDALLEADYKKIQKIKTSEDSFIECKYILSIIIGSLSLEWFLRKYLGLI